VRDADFILPPCDCPPCRQAGVSAEPGRRDPYSGRILHGEELRRWYEAKDKFVKLARKAVGSRGRHEKGFERLVQREPGMEG
jgi:hypothetical protein